jgi:hypothetical protein
MGVAFLYPTVVKNLRKPITTSTYRRGKVQIHDLKMLCFAMQYCSHGHSQAKRNSKTKKRLICLRSKKEIDKLLK